VEVHGIEVVDIFEVGDQYCLIVQINGALRHYYLCPDKDYSPFNPELHPGSAHGGAGLMIAANALKDHIKREEEAKAGVAASRAISTSDVSGRLSKAQPPDRCKYAEPILAVKDEVPESSRCRCREYEVQFMDYHADTKEIVPRSLPIYPAIQRQLTALQHLGA
jgi:hypothetical protein